MTATSSPAPTAEARSPTLETLDVSLAERFAANAHGPHFARLRRDAPVHFCPASAHGAYWSITRYDDIVEVEKNHRQFSSDGNVIIGDVPSDFDATRAFATSDPPVHTRERRAVAPALSPGRLVALEAEIRADIRAVLQDLPVAEPFDWVERVAVELTTRMVAVLFDFPREERRLLPYWSAVLVTSPEPGALVSTWAERDAVLQEYAMRISQLWQQRASNGGDDIISALARSPDTAAMIHDMPHLLGTVSLLAGANEASRGALAGSVVAFHQFPDEWHKLRADRHLVGNAAAELLRWQTPITHMRRTAAEDVEFHGKRIKKGERVVLWYCSGNRDERHFDAGDEFRIERPNATRHLAYGFGIHRCLGRHVAQLQVRILLEELLAHFERVELVAEPKRIASNFSAGFQQVLVRLQR